MASILDRYGIKEVADVVFWNTDNEPVLYLDTLKVSTIEETAEQTEARGGKGNPPLIIWDYGKEITITLEDALFSMKSMAVMHNKNLGIATSGTISAAKQFTAETVTVDGSTTVIAPNIPAGASIYSETGEVVASTNLTAGTKYLATWLRDDVQDMQQIVITSRDFPGTYRITGDTYARSQESGEDEFFQFEIPLAKVNPEQTITMQAEGDPSTFSMTVRVMRPPDGKMMKLTKYSTISGSSSGSGGNG